MPEKRTVEARYFIDITEVNYISKDFLSSDWESLKRVTLTEFNLISDLRLSGLGVKKKIEINPRVYNLNSKKANRRRASGSKWSAGDTMLTKKVARRKTRASEKLAIHNGDFPAYIVKHNDPSKKPVYIGVSKSRPVIIASDLRPIPTMQQPTGEKAEPNWGRIPGRNRTRVSPLDSGHGRVYK